MDFVRFDALARLLGRGLPRWTALLALPTAATGAIGPEQASPTDARRPLRLRVRPARGRERDRAGRDRLRPTHPVMRSSEVYEP